MGKFEKVFIDSDGDICREGDGDNLVLVCAVSEIGAHGACLPLNPDYIAEIIRRFNAYDDLVAALESIASNSCCDGCQEAALVARAALSAIRQKVGE
ncbi:MAG: hypothetical protein ACRC52_07470 [Aeromonas veronii]